MLQWALIFSIVVLIAGVLGFGGIAKILFLVFLVLFAVSLIAGRRPRGAPPL